MESVGKYYIYEKFWEELADYIPFTASYISIHDLVSVLPSRCLQR